MLCIVMYTWVLEAEDRTELTSALHCHVHLGP